jgi:DNA-binding transcriptional ArsR family regulator
MKNKVVHKACNCLKALAHETRLGIIWLLRDGERNVNDLASELDVSLSNISQHLRILRDREILETRKKGNQVFYRLNDPRILEIVEILRQLHCHED